MVFLASSRQKKTAKSINSENLIRTFSIPSLDNIAEGWTYYHDLEDIIDSNYDDKYLAEIIIRCNDNCNETNFTNIVYIDRCNINYVLDDTQRITYNGYTTIYTFPNTSPLTTLVCTMGSSINNLPVAFVTDGIVTQGLYSGTGICFNRSISQYFAIFLSKQNFLIAFYNILGIELPFLEEITFKIYKSPYTEIAPYTE